MLWFEKETRAGAKMLKARKCAGAYFSRSDNMWFESFSDNTARLNFETMAFHWSQALQLRMIFETCTRRFIFVSRFFFQLNIFNCLIIKICGKNTTHCQKNGPTTNISATAIDGVLDALLDEAKLLREKTNATLYLPLLSIQEM